MRSHPVLAAPRRTVVALRLATGCLLAAACESTPTDGGVGGLLVVRVRGDAQAAPVRSTVPIPPAVRVTDGRGAPLAGRAVRFVAPSGSGVVEPTTPVFTDASGIAAASFWTLGPIAGEQTVYAVVADSTSVSGERTVTFTASARAAAPTRLSLGDPFRALVVNDTFTAIAELRDADFNPVIDSTRPRFATDSPAIATVDSNGQVTARATGTTRLTATLRGLETTILVAVGSPPTRFSATRAAVAVRGNGIAVRDDGLVYLTHAMGASPTRFRLPPLTDSGAVVGIGAARDVVFSPDGARAWFAADSRIIGVNTTTHVAVDSVRVDGAVLRLRITADGRYLAATTSTGVIARLTVATGEMRTITTDATELNGLTLHPMRPVLFATATNGVLYEVELEPFVQRRRVLLDGVRSQSLVVTADGERIVIANEYGPLEVRDAGTLARLLTVSAGAGAFDVLLTPNARYLLVAQPDAVTVLDANTFVRHQQFPAAIPRRLAVSRDGAWVLGTLWEGALLVLR